MKKDEALAKKIGAWLADDYPRHARWRRAIAGVYHNRIPRTIRPLPAVHWGAKTGLTASAPFVALYYGSIGQTTAFIAAAGLFVANGLVALLGLAAQPKAPADHPQTEALIRFGDLLTAFKTDAVVKSKRSDAIRACLGILEIHARRITKTAKGDLSVSLVQYVGSSQTRMTVSHRNPGNTRPVGREFDRPDLLGHHACCAGSAPRVVHNLAHFGRSQQSPTSSTIDYKSLFFIPLEVPSARGGTRMKGFVSIDCRQPYAFYGNRSREIAVTCRPIVDHLKDLLREPS